MYLIRHYELTSPQSTIEFTNIPQTYTDLVLVLSARTNEAITSWSDVALQFNGSASGYSNRLVYGAGSGAGTGLTETAIFARVNPANTTANSFSNYLVHVFNYSGNTPKQVSLEGATETNATLAIIKTGTGVWSGTDPITSLSLVCNAGVNLVQFSSATLYGVLAGSDGVTSVS